MEYKWSALIVTTVGTVMGGIDTRILVIGLPTIANQLHAGAVDVIWIAQAYLLATTVCLLLIGRISDLVGRVKLYNLGFVIFTVGSALSAISFNSSQLILFRVVQGVGAALLQTNSAAIITDAAPTRQLGTMLGVNQLAWRIGNIAGLTLSGLILTLTDWRGLFFVNVPIGIAGTVWAMRKLREISVNDRSKKIDWMGFATFSVGLTLVLLAITYLSYGIAGYVDGFMFLVVGLALIAAFVRIESSTSSPLLDMRLFEIRLFAVGNFAQAMNSLAWGAVVLLVAFYLQVGLGYSPLQAGIAILPLDLSFMISTIIGGRFSDKYGSRVLSSLGMIIITVSFVGAFAMNASTPYIIIAVVLLAVGAGNGLFISPNMRAIMSSVPANRRGIASGFRNTMFNIGFTSSYGLSILFLTAGISYSSLSSLLQGIGTEAVLVAAKSEFFIGFKISMLILAAIQAAPIVPTILWGHDPPSSSNEDQVTSDTLTDSDI
ncbi:MAG: MFS transporter [Nitrososphaerota archaeon]|nr:MFS transporter [Nitrososphaerota archaeon]